MASKAELRERVRQQRRARGAAGAAALRDRVTARLLDLVAAVDARTVACFASTKLEPPTNGFLRAAREAGIRVLLPRIASDTELTWHADTDAWDAPGAFGVAQPAGPLVASGLATAELIVVPAAAVDLAGHRLGWGAGYYDRALAPLPPAQRAQLAALVHDDEVMPALPHDPHDVPVSGIVTPSRTLRIHRAV